MPTTNAAHEVATARTSAAIADEITQRQTRRATIDTQLADIRAQLTQLRAERARALADGNKDATAGEIARLTDDATALAEAVELLGTDIATLEREARGVAITEAAAVEREAITIATVAADEMDRLLRTLAAETVGPVADRLNAALKAAREAVHRHDHLIRQSDPAALPGIAEDRAGRAIHRRGAMMALVTTIRSYGATDA